MKQIGWAIKVARSGSTTFQVFKTREEARKQKIRTRNTYRIIGLEAPDITVTIHKVWSYAKKTMIDDKVTY